MRTIGFPISTKENEFRRALLPQDVCKLQYPQFVYIEEGYGDALGYNDDN